MIQDYRQLSPDQIEQLEKQTLRTIVQTIQDHTKEAKSIFDNTRAESETEVIVLAEDLVEYALRDAECFPIQERFAGFIDYKQVRWLGTVFGTIPQVLLVDARASTENNRDTLQQSQLPMDAEFISRGQVTQLTAGIPAHQMIPMHDGTHLPAITTSAFVHFYYQGLKSDTPPFRNLRSVFVLGLPHQSLKAKYNPDPRTGFFGQGKHSPRRQEQQRIRVYFNRLRGMCPWRLQELAYEGGTDYAIPMWRDVEVAPNGSIRETNTPFSFIGL